MAEKLRTLDFGDGKGARVLVPDWANVDNKPFGEGLMALVDNQTIPIADGQGLIPISTPLTGGQEYTVIYNGTEYVVTAVESEGAVVAGNLGALGGGEDTGEPFVIICSPQANGIVAFDGSEKVILTIIGQGVKKLDKAYIPDTTVRLYYMGYSSDGTYLYKDINYTEMLTREELKKLMYDNARIVLWSTTRVETPLYIQLEKDYGVIFTLYGNGESAYPFYTAEYTG